VYEVVFTPAAERQLGKMPRAVQRRIIMRLDVLPMDPRPAGVKKLHGHDGHYRLRVGDWRIIYVIDDPTQTLTITKVAHRSDAY
jgi:mRNA interferase RelE/StbE